jgi:predicted acetyltransferase
LVAEFVRNREPFVPFVLGFEHDDFDAMLARLADCAHGIGLPDGFVAHSTYWLVDADEQVVGVSNIRHALTPALRREGGNIGYGVRPSARGRGYGTHILRLSLARAAELGLSEVLLTCAKENVRSARAILANGGLLASEEYLAHRGEVVQRYRIPIAARSTHLQTRLRLLTGEPGEMAELQRVLEDAAAYTELVTGAPPGPADAQSMYTVLPPGKSYDDKFVFGIYREDRMVGCADLIRSHPDSRTAHLGLLLIAEGFQRQGVGRAAYRALEDYVRAWGTCDRMRLGVVRANDRVLPFWSDQGFVPSGEVKPYRYGNVRSEVIILTKALATRTAAASEPRTKPARRED